jgi:cell division protein FtsZ
MKKSMEVKPKIETFARIKVLGVGGSGTNAVNRMTELGIKGVEFIAINTDAQALHNNNADRKVHIGKGVTKGLGSGMNPELGRQAAEESMEELTEVVDNADMVFLTCGLGGGTGTGASPIIAELAKNKGILTVAVVTKPFTFEGSKRKEVAETGYDNLKDKVDAIISVHNDRILQIIDKKTSLIEAFRTVDEVLRQGIAGISDLITTHGIVNADFADVRSIMQDAGTALMGIGRASGDTRAQDAAKLAINSPLLEMTIDGAKGILFNITGGTNLGMHEIDEAAKMITKGIDSDAKVKFGAVIDESMGDEVRITVIATGFDEGNKRPSQMPMSLSEEPKKAQNLENKNFNQPVAAMEARKPLFNPRPAPVSSPMPKIQTEEPVDDELEIPAFIRKKMK